MAAPKRATHRVVQSGLYFQKNESTGRLEELEIDTQMTLTSDQAKKLESRGFVKSLKATKSVDVSEAPSEDDK